VELRNKDCILLLRLPIQCAIDDVAGDKNQHDENQVLCSLPDFVKTHGASWKFLLLTGITFQYYSIGRKTISIKNRLQTKPPTNSTVGLR
jgi:hypothetical protein